jgi:RNA polymerase sigma factor (sigma-70 family)
VIDFTRGLAGVPTVNIHGLESMLCSRDLDPAAAYERNRQQRIVHEAFAVLEERISPTNHRILHLRWIEGQSVSEVAADLDLTRKQVSKRQYGVKQRLRRLLETQDGLLTSTGWSE